jgi:DNA-binding Xre family transcriptional regulator
MEYRNLDIGKLIDQKWDRNKISVTQLAETTGISRANIYNIVKRKSIDTDMLISLSKALNYPFLEEYLTTDFPTICSQVVLNVEVTGTCLKIKQIEDENPKV